MKAHLPSRRRRVSWLSTAVLVLPLPVPAAVQLASPFTTHMVLQRDLPVPVWGGADPGEQVTVTFAGQTKSARAGADGQWRVDLDPMAASAESRSFRVTGSETAQPVVLDDVLVGEVWLGSGQSNMSFSVSKTRYSWAGVINEEQEIAAANHPLIRMFTAAGTKAYEPQERVDATWEVCSPATVPAFSAVGYFFARDLQKEIQVPVGIIASSFGASCAHAWVRREVAESTPEFKAVLDRFDQQVRAYQPPTEAEMQAWREAAAQARAAGQRAPRQPGRDPVQDQHNVTVCYNGMIAPLVPYAIRGVLWYQGESITSPKELFPKWNEALVRDWRQLWGRELPFFVCQLAALDNNSNNPQVREWQADILSLPATGMAVTIDIGNRTDVHPHNKQDLGDRLTRLALARVYGRDLEDAGPTFTRAVAEGDAMRVSFSHTTGGLVARGGPLKWFEVAGADGRFVPAEAAIAGDSVVVRSPEVTAPVAVRYAWANYPEGCNLYNGAGLPAAPFRSNRPTP